MTRTTQIIATLFVIVAGFILWNIITKDPEVATLSATDSKDTSSVGDAKTLETLINMRNLRLDGRVFESAAFNALVNTERQIVREPVGRPNPFSPVGTEASAPIAEPQPGAGQSPRSTKSQPANPQTDPTFDE
jgi:hypothetical protein